MTRRTFWLAILLLVSDLAIPPPLVLAQPVYEVEDLGTIDGLVPTVLGMNEHGDIAGFVTLPSGQSRPVLYVDGVGLTYVPGLEASDGQATAINAYGGLAGHRAVSGVFRAFRHESGATADLGTLGGSASFAFGINDSGVVAGFAYLAGDAVYHGFRVWPGGWLEDLGTLGGALSVACGINRHGHVAGYAQTAAGAFRLFRFEDEETGLQDLGTLGGPHSQGCAINAAGQVAGQAQTATNGWRAVRHTDGEGLLDLDSFDSFLSMAEAINDAGDVAGWYFSGAGMRAFLYMDDHGAMDLNTRIDATAGWTLASARAVNDAGQVAGQGQHDGMPRAFRLTPVMQSDVEPPVIERAQANPHVLWPPDGRMVPVQLSVYAWDDTDPAPRCWIAGIEDDDPSGEPDAWVTGDLAAELRAARSGQGTGRTYLLTVACADASGNATSAGVPVHVPHDRGRR